MDLNGKHYGCRFNPKQYCLRKGKKLRLRRTNRGLARRLTLKNVSAEVIPTRAMFVATLCTGLSGNCDTLSDLLPDQKYDATCTESQQQSKELANILDVDFSVISSHSSQGFTRFTSRPAKCVV